MIRPRAIFFNAFKNSFPYLALLIRRYFSLILRLYVFLVSLAVLAHYLSVTPSRNLILSFLTPVCIQFICLILVGFVIVFVTPYILQQLINEEVEGKFIPLPHSFKKFFKDNFRLWLNEISRALSVSYLFAFFFIVPGIIKFFRYSFVSHIVLFNENFKIKRRESTLKHSAQLTKGFIPWFVLLGLGYITLSYLIGSFTDQWRKENFSSFVVFAFLIDYAFIMAYSFLWGIVYHQIYLSKDPYLSPRSESYDEPPSTFPQVGL